jgi:hypothetical protein
MTRKTWRSSFKFAMKYVGTNWKFKFHRNFSQNSSTLNVIKIRRAVFQLFQTYKWTGGTTNWAALMGKQMNVLETCFLKWSYIDAERFGRKPQTRLLVREGAPHKQIRNWLKIIKERWKTIGSASKMGARHEGRLADWPSVVIYLWLWRRSFCEETAFLNGVERFSRKRVFMRM